jgi:hypothetical protein
VDGKEKKRMGQTRIYDNKLVKISRENIPTGRRSPGSQKRRLSD